MAKKRELKKGERVVWVVRGETTRPESMGFPDAFRQDYKFYNTKKEAEDAIKRGGLFPVSHRHVDLLEWTKRTMRPGGEHHKTGKRWNQPDKTKVQKLEHAGEAVDAHRKLMKEGVHCGLCGNRMNIGSEYHIINGKYYHIFNCTGQRRKV